MKEKDWSSQDDIERDKNSLKEGLKSVGETENVVGGDRVMKECMKMKKRKGRRVESITKEVEKSKKIKRGRKLHRAGMGTKVGRHDEVNCKNMKGRNEKKIRKSRRRKKTL